MVFSIQDSFLNFLSICFMLAIEWTFVALSKSPLTPNNQSGNLTYLGLIYAFLKLTFGNKLLPEFLLALNTS
jgi:hypothetical protein